MLTVINLLAHSCKNQSIYLLSVSPDSIKFPSINLDTLKPTKDISVKKIIEKLYSQHIVLDYNWAQPKLLDIDMFLSEEELLQTHIFYSCYIPYDTTIKDSSWVIADDLIPYSNILKKALLCST
jgi:hypothetical protein